MIDLLGQEQAGDEPEDTRSSQKQGPSGDQRHQQVAYSTDTLACCELLASWINIIVG